jgi:fermentation-respiration switch protein FrsA (DUF1100 family)
VLTRVAVYLAVILIAAYLFAQYARRTSMFFPSREGDWKVADGHQEVWFNSRDGVRLNGWLYRAREPNAPLIVWCHGNAGNLIDRTPMAAELARRGISVLLFDWRGYGKSEGHPSEDALYDDALAAYDFAATIDPNIVVYGESLGGPYAAYVASKRKVRRVIIENSFPSLAALGNAIYRPVPLGWFAPRAMMTLRWLNAAGVPVLVLHSRADQVIPFPLGQKLYDGLRVPKEMVVSDTAAHCEMPVAEPEKYYGAVVRFAKGTG